MWSPWQEHDGKGCPLPAGVTVHVCAVSPDGRKRETMGPCDPTNVDWDWSNYGKIGRLAGTDDLCIVGKIVRYRTRRYRAADALMQCAGNAGVTA